MMLYLDLILIGAQLAFGAIMMMLNWDMRRMRRKMRAEGEGQHAKLMEVNAILRDRMAEAEALLAAHPDHHAELHAIFAKPITFAEPERLTRGTPDAQA